MDVRVPRLAEGVESATVANILVSAGDRIEKDQVILELETEKAVGPIPSPASGQVAKIHVKPGDEVNVGQALITLAQEGTAVEKAPPAEKKGQPAGDQKSPAAAPQPQRTAALEATPPSDYQYESPGGIPPPASPSVRKIARELGIDLARVQGSERGGRITLADLKNYVEQLQQRRPA